MKIAEYNEAKKILDELGEADLQILKAKGFKNPFGISGEFNNILSDILQSCTNSCIEALEKRKRELLDRFQAL